MVNDARALEQSGQPNVTNMFAITVGTIPIQFPYYKCKRVMIKNKSTNTGKIYVGTTSAVSSLNGFELVPNGGLGFSADQTDKFWVVSDTSAQTVEILYTTDPGGIAYSGGTNPTSGASNVNIDEFGGTAVTIGPQATSLSIPVVTSLYASPVASQTTITTAVTQLPSQACSVAIIKNDDGSGQAIYLGGSGVTSSTGFKLAAGEGVVVECANSNIFYAITSSSTATADVITLS